MQNPIYVTLKSNNQRVMVMPTIDTIGSAYLTCIFPNNNYPKNTFILQNVRRERVRFRKEDINRFVNWETAVLRDNQRLARFGQSRMDAESAAARRKATAAMVTNSINAELAKPAAD